MSHLSNKLFSKGMIWAFLSFVLSLLLNDNTTHSPSCLTALGARGPQYVLTPQPSILRYFTAAPKISALHLELPPSMTAASLLEALNSRLQAAAVPQCLQVVLVDGSAGKNERPLTIDALIDIANQRATNGAGSQCFIWLVDLNEATSNNNDLIPLGNTLKELLEHGTIRGVPWQAKLVGSEGGVIVLATSMNRNQLKVAVSPRTVMKIDTVDTIL